MKYGVFYIDNIALRYILCWFYQHLDDISSGLIPKGVDHMQQKDMILQNAPVYVTANSLMQTHER